MDPASAQQPASKGGTPVAREGNLRGNQAAQEAMNRLSPPEADQGEMAGGEEGGGMATAAPPTAPAAPAQPTEGSVPEGPKIGRAHV